MADLSHFVFVYGTLKTGEPNHDYMMDETRGKLKLVGKGKTQTSYPLVIATDYNIPFLLNVPSVGLQIRGEVYRVDDTKLKHLDKLEDYPTLYDRQIEKIIMEDNGEILEAKMYFLRKHRPSMLQLEYHQSYESLGSHGKKFLRGLNPDSLQSSKIEEIKKDIAEFVSEPKQ